VVVVVVEIHRFFSSTPLAREEPFSGFQVNKDSGAFSAVFCAIQRSFLR
jgi:hypothetical protein